MNSRVYKISGIICLIIFGLILYLPYINVKEFEGEEGRRVLIALQMIENKEFLIPQLFGKFYFTKPPLFNWILAFFFCLTKNCSEFIARSVSSIMALIGALFMVCFWEKILNTSKIKISFWIYLIPGLIFLTVPEVIDKALRAEIDMTFVLIITLALFSWFYFYEVKQQKKLGFIISGIFLGLGILTKTFQALTFFYLTIIPYFIIQKRFKEIFNLSHLLGILFCFLVFLLWAIPVNLKVGIEPFIKAWLIEYKGAASGAEVSLGQHLKTYIFSALLGYAPWIFLLTFYKNKEFRNQFLNRYPVLKKLVLFSFCLFVFSYLFYFIFPGARFRYMLPSIGGLVFLTAIIVLYFFMYPQKFWETKILKYFSYFLTSLLLIGSLVFFVYTILVFQGNFLFLYLNILLLITLCLLFFIKIKTKNSFVYIFLHFVLLVFFTKQIYVSFYYSYHRQKFDYFRKAAIKIAQILQEDHQKKLYLFNAIPHHLIYYLKYRLKAINEVKYLPDIKKLPINQWVLIPEKSFSKIDLDFRNYYKLSLKVRKKRYILLKRTA